MKNKFLLLGIAIAIGAFVMHGCSEDYYFEEDFDSLAERRMTRSVTEPATGDEGYKTYSYPEVTTIASSPKVISAMNEAWNMTLNSCTPLGRCEYGFYIYYDHAKGEYYVGDINQGEILDNRNIGPAQVPLGGCSNNVDVCAFFHTHTSLEYFEIADAYKDPGASSADQAFASNHKIPGIIYDYPYRISAGDYKDINPAVYYVVPPSKREDQIFPINYN